MARDPVARRLCIAMVTLSLSISASALAQDKPAPPEKPTPRPEDVEDDPREILLEGERASALAAATKLFIGGKEDAWLADKVLKAGESRPEARRFLLESLSVTWRIRPAFAGRLARLAIFDPDATVRESAAKALTNIETPDAYALLEDALREAAKLQGIERGPAIDTVIRAVEGKKPRDATCLLVTKAWKIVATQDQTRVQEALFRLTHRWFATQQDAESWFEKHKNLSPKEWLEEVLKQLEADRDRASRAAEVLFDKLLRSHGQDDGAKLAELREALLGKDFSIPAVRLAAIKALGSFRRNEKAVDVLVQVIEASSKEQEDELREALIALGSTEEPKAFPVVKKFLESSPSRRLKLAAIQALGNLRSEEGVPILLRHLVGQQLDETDPEAAARVAAAIGRIGKDPGENAANALMQMIERVQAQASGPQPRDPKVVRDLLQGACTGLGGVAPSLGPALSPKVAETLTKLSEHQDDDVRREATLALGSVRDDSALAPLAARLKKGDEALKVRKAAIKAIGDQAARLGATDKFADLVDQLGLGLTVGDDVLKAEARSELKRLASRDKLQLETLSALVTALKKRTGQANAALSLLEELPSVKSVGELTAPRAELHWQLILERAEVRLSVSMRTEALADYEDLLLSPLVAPGRAETARRIRLGRARALLKGPIEDLRKSSDQAAEVARSNPGDPEAWQVLLDAWKQLIEKGENKVVKELFASVQKAVEGAPAEQRAAVNETVKKADDAPKAPPDTGGK
jgi:HEAT repeat protein